MRISHTARTLLFRVFSARYVCADAADDEFTLPWSKIATWCGLASESQSREVVNELRRFEYLWDNGVKGCPPCRVFRLNLKLNLEKLVNHDGIIPPETPRKSPSGARLSRGFQKLRESLA